MIRQPDAKHHRVHEERVTIRPIGGGLPCRVAAGRGRQIRGQGPPFDHGQDETPRQRPARQPMPRRVDALEERRLRLVGPGQLERIAEVRTKLARVGQVPTPSRVVADLTFGFWVALLRVGRPLANGPRRRSSAQSLIAKLPEQRGSANRLLPAAAPADRRRHAPEPAGAGYFGHLRTDRSPDRALGASDGLLGLPMDAGGAGRLNRSSPSCLNRPAQRTAFFHGLLNSRLPDGSMCACRHVPQSPTPRIGRRPDPRTALGCAASDAGLAGRSLAKLPRPGPGSLRSSRWRAPRPTSGRRPQPTTFPGRLGWLGGGLTGCPLRGNGARGAT